MHLTVHGIWKPLGEPGDIQQDSNVNLISEDLSGTGEFGANLLDLQWVIFGISILTLFDLCNF